MLFITKCYRSVFLCFCLFVFMQGCSVAQLPDASAKVNFPELRQVLLDMQQINQKQQQKVINQAQQDPQACDKGCISDVEHELVALTDKQVAKIKTIFSQHSLLTSADIGKDGLSALVQLISNNYNTDFKEQMLPVIKQLYQLKELSGHDYAVLYDLVQMEKGLPQYYGTILNEENGHYVLAKIQDPENVDFRRSQLGLASLSDYLQLFSSHSTTRYY